MSVGTEKKTAAEMSNKEILEWAKRRAAEKQIREREVHGRIVGM